jgi:multidrug efflux system membrane fusion protein
VRVGLAGEEGYPHIGELDFVDNRLNTHTGTIQLRAVIPNPDDLFKPGQFARVETPVERLDRALLVNQKAVLTDQDRRYVYVVDEEDRVERRDVEPGPRLDELVLIRSGLQSGERVVVNGLQKILFSGMSVQPELVAMRAPDAARQLAAAR